MEIPLSKIFLFLSSQTKKEIIMHLYICKCKECYVSKVCSILKQKQANISKHIIDLKKANVVHFKKNKQNVQYCLSEEFIYQYYELLEFIKKRESTKCYCSEGE